MPYENRQERVFPDVLNFVAGGGDQKHIGHACNGMVMYVRGATINPRLFGLTRNDLVTAGSGVPS